MNSESLLAVLYTRNIAKKLRNCSEKDAGDQNILLALQKLFTTIFLAIKNAI